MENKNEVATIGEKAALVPMEFNTAQVELIKKTVAKGTTNDELSLFLYTCKRTGLDPLIRQIYAVKRGGVSNQMSIQTGIDGYRLIAERTGKYAPGKEPSYNEKDGKLISATAYVNKLVSGTWHEVAATAFYEEYKNDINPIWKKMPHAMLSKCAEALALRKAFPAEMAGVYTSEEMEQATPAAAGIPAAPMSKSAMAKEAATAPTQPAENAELVAKGLVAFHKPPQGKGPHTFKVGECQDYLKTFDEMVAERLLEHKAKGTIVEVSYRLEKKGDFANNMITGISVQA